MKTIPAAASFLLAAIIPASAASLAIDKTRSRIQVDAKATGHQFAGTLQDYVATVSGNARSLEPSAFSLNWKFSDLKTGDDGRDVEMLKWLGGQSSEGSFKFTKTWQEAGAFHAQGTLTIHGLSKALSFPYTVKKEGDWVTVDGTVAMDYQDFGLPLIRNFAVMKVDPALSVRFHLVGQLK